MEHAFGGMVITLEGDLGAGKTTFTKGIGKALNIEDTVKSPTFTIMREYVGDYTLYHMDVYRLAGASEDIGYDDYFYLDGICVVEWAHLIDEFLPVEYLEIIINNIDETSRKIKLIPHGEKYKEICEVIV
jgi:tRNA threonylcarbamoyladenosine biosynthesis protein TsaE